jgi:serine/threonine-protein kinase
LRPPQEIAEHGEAVGVHPQILEGHAGAVLDEDPDDDLLSIHGGQRRHAHVVGLRRHDEARAAILGLAAFRDVHVRHDLDAGDHAVLDALGHGHDRAQQAIHAVAQADRLLLRLDVDVGSRGPHGVGEDRVHELDHGLAQGRLGDVLFRAQLDLGVADDHQLLGQADVLELREGGLLRGVEALDGPDDLALGGDDRPHAQAGGEPHGVGGGEVRGIGHDQVQLAILDEPRQAGVLDRELLADAVQDFHGNVDGHEVGGGDLQLLGQGLADLRLGGDAQVDQEAAEAHALLPGAGQGLAELSLGDDALLHEDLAELLAPATGGRGRGAHLSRRGTVYPGRPPPQVSAATIGHELNCARMPRCRACSSPTPDGGRFCPSCGEPLEATDVATGTAPRPSPAASPRPSPRPAPGTPTGVPSPPASASTPPGRAAAGARFVPGTVLAERYRMVGPLGKGGMGEVYRADDLKLGLPVALKFLPESVQDDPDRLERLFNEVRLAREITHPAVCRVHDVGEVLGQHFISMEYVDGEDLASLLRRIGRLPGDKALEIARQLCAGLAAAHDKGVLHRDFKPQNVMLDGRGKVRITDFGLATLAARTGDDVRSGTPAYMAPEQLEGREVSERSDVYALGLVLYELFTGRRAVTGRSLEEVARQQREQEPPTPSRLVADIDPVVERAIVRCLEKDPRERPASALAVAALLPGGDPLAAALAAGETPSPELVAASGRTEGLSPRVVRRNLMLVAAGLAGALFLAPNTHLIGMVPTGKPPQVLEDRAREVVKALGWGDEAAIDFDAGLTTERGYFTRQKDPSPHRWDALRAGRPAALLYWYRQSPRYLVAWNRRSSPDWNDPPLTDPGMIGVRLDLEGRLLQFYANPPRIEPEDPPPATEPDWTRLLTEAGLDPARFHAVPPRRFGLSPTDARAAWEGTYPERPDMPVRVEASAYRGRVTSYLTVLPWHTPDPQQRGSMHASRGIAAATTLLVGALLVGAPALLARRHLRAGRGDRAGASRLAYYVVGSYMLGWALGSHHVADPIEGDFALVNVAMSLLTAGYVWLMYLALEPYVRRSAPFAIVSWTRLLSGRHRDPLVGRDVLVGTAWGAVMGGLTSVAMILPARLGQPAVEPRREMLSALLGWGDVVDALLGLVVAAALLGMGLLLLWSFVHGSRARARVALSLTFFAAACVTMPMFPHDSPAIPLAAAAVFGAATTLLLVRFGLLATIVGIGVKSFFHLPLTRDLTGWVGAPTVAVLVVIAALALWSARTTLAGRPLLTLGD